MFTQIRSMQHKLRIMTGRILLSMIHNSLFIILFSLFMIHPVYAQTPSTSSGQASTSSAITLPTTNYQLPATISPTSPLYTDMLVHNMFHTFSCLAVGSSVIGQPCLTYQITKDAQGAIQGIPVLSQVNLQGGTLGAVTGLIGALYQNPPVRTADYLASVGKDLGIVKEANAQVVGSGANVLSPILSLWQVSRNIAYLIMIIIFIIIGLMVMFRNRINPQTVITAQAALPGLVIGLILITFSYFLAGLISDLAFVGTNIVGYYFAAAQGATADSERINLAQHISGKSVLNIMGAFVGIASNHAGDIVNTIIDAMPPWVATHLRLFIGFMGAQLLAPVGGLAGPFAPIVSAVVSIVGGTAASLDILGLRSFVIQLVVEVILVYTMLRLLLRLINNYLTIIFLTLSAPFQFLFASLPGRQAIATGWILDMLGNILVFPAVIAVFYFAAVLLSFEPGIRDPNFPLKVSGINQIQNNFPSPAYAADTINVIDKQTFPLFGGMNLEFIKILLALGALIAVPAIPDIIIRAIGRSSQAGQLLGQEISSGVRSGQGYAGQYANRITGTLDTSSKGLFGEHAMGPGGQIYTVRKGLFSKWTERMMGRGRTSGGTVT